ncbi:DUF6457 domain-containing protein [Cellulomonas endophytica]|uniref:DUF6457 domain-containing protein n=1 Tax=Cellulomonas endophytica TaxID=2494735 RepID=UPI001011AE2C|nr:DUF6457 domain-containing protein [Cellulomonas endophytica]
MPSTGPSRTPVGGDLERWLDLVCPALGLDRAVVAAVTGPVLDRVRDVAHDVVRPGAPLTAMLVGLAAGAAVGEGASPDRLEAAVRERLLVVDRLVAGWAPPAG